MTRILEICIDSVESLNAAIVGGANRVEVCSALDVGGLTPSLAFLKYIRNEVKKEVKDRKFEIYAMIRPRQGDFCYTPQEVNIMEEEIKMMINENLVDGFVFGLLLSNGTIDYLNCKRLLGVCKEIPVTFHRAFDVCNDVFQCLDKVIELGFKRILTSGQMLKAENGIDLITELVKRANDRIIIMPGSGINANNLHSIALQTNCKEFHSSASIHKYSSMHQSMNENEVFEIHFNKWKVTESNYVNILVNILHQIP